jgi:dTDP-4-dehydrorhamnose 3,5-epimerase
MSNHLTKSSLISGVIIANLKSFGDDRGRFREVFRKEWFPQRSWDTFQSNVSQSSQGVLRGLHYHYNQVDYWYVPSGKLRAGLFDMRPLSPTYGATQTIDMGEENDLGLFIPVGVAHGFSALTDVTMMYIVDNYYDNSDEYGVKWNDPLLNIDWGLTDPIVSDRDKNNPTWAEIMPANII